MKHFDEALYIQRNEQLARERYGDLLQADGTVQGTDIWFDEKWRFHYGRAN